MKKYSVLTVIFLLLLTGSWSPLHAQIPRQAVREADVTWSKRVWRSIDLREKQNQCFYFPLQASESRPNFLGQIVNGIRNKKIRAYADEDLLEPFDRDKLLSSLYLVGDSVEVEYYREDGEPYYVRQPGPVDSLWFFENFCSLVLKEDWFFDKNVSSMNVRTGVVGICLYRREKEDLGCNPFFWLSFEACRQVFAGIPVFNPHNDDQSISFEDLFIKRMFSSVVIKESNVADRTIDAYAHGIDALLESERIKYELLIFEHDLWQY